MRIIGMAPDAPGGFGEYFLLSEGLARELPDGLPVERLALIDAMAVGWYYSRIGSTGEAALNSVPLVIGLGAIGLSVVAALRHRGVGPIIASDYSEPRRRLALDMGADVVVDPVPSRRGLRGVPSPGAHRTRSMTGSRSSASPRRRSTSV
jgi:threonine dehydrogenase-like Zn-dependent dehydrogenase